MLKLATMAKALYAGAAAGLGAIATVLVDDTSIGDLTDGQWVTVVLATLVAFGGTWGISNRPTG